MLYRASMCFLSAFSLCRTIEPNTACDDQSCASSLTTIEKLEYQELEGAKLELLQSRTISKKATLYALGIAGANGCSLGQITDPVKCNAAGSSFGRSDLRTGSWSTAPKGCYKTAYSKKIVNFNAHPIGTGENWATPICQALPENSSQSTSATSYDKAPHMHWFRSKSEVRANASQITNQLEVIHNTKSLASKIFEDLSREMEYELNMDVPPVKSKVALGIINVLGLGCCGIDRCYLGQTCIGILKGVTLGGLLIWALIDYFIIAINALEKDESINVFGFNAKFDVDNGQIGTAFWIAVIGLVLKCLLGPLCRSSSTRSNQPNECQQQ